ncbi:MAG: asparaginase [Bacteroidetes bacterium]|nr:MAG: asparaginase [Bacteroidota bacterium]
MLNYYKTINIQTVAGQSADTSILVIYTGGTIGMDYDRQTKTLVPFNFTKILEKVPELTRFDFELTVLSLRNPLDSANFTSENWVNIARMIYDFYSDYDAFVILHGTDTMAYSASAVSYLLQNIGKPVIFTGSQLPIGMTRTDARENFISALEIAASKTNGKASVPEVCIFFDNLLLRGNRARKVQSVNFTAFESENYPPLAVAGVTIDFNENYIMPHSTDPFYFYNKVENNVLILKIFPSIQPNYLENILGMEGLKGVVLETYGAGTAPTSPFFIKSLENAIQKGVIIYNVSQCNGGRVVQSIYETSHKLAEIGVISGNDITPEAAITKLMFLLANESDQNVIRQKLKSPICGEMSIPLEK